MHRALAQGMSGAMALLGFSCSTVPPSTSAAEAPAPAEIPTESVGIANATLPAPEDARAVEGDVDDFEPGGTLTLEQALRLALRRNPDLALQPARVDAVAGQLEQASVRPSPVASLEVEDVLGTGAYHSAVVNQTTLYLSQQLELGGKRSRRMAVAEEQSRTLAQLHEVERVEVLRSTGRAFLAVVRAQEELQFAEELLAMQRDLHEAQLEQIRAGRTPESEQERSRAAVALAEVQRTQARSALHRSRLELAPHLGEVRPRFEEVSGPGEVRGDLPVLEELLERLEGNASLQLESARVALGDATVSRERAARVPDLELAVGLRRFEEEDDLAFVFGFSIPLTITNPNRGNLLTAEAERKEAKLRHALVDDRLSTRLAAIYSALSNTLEEVRTLEENVLPAAEQSYVHSEEGFRLGSFSYLELRQAQDTLISARRQLSDARIRFHEAWIDLQALTDDFAVGSRP